MERGSGNHCMNETEKSDNGIVPMKLADKGGNTPAEQGEGRPLAKGNTPHATIVRTQSRVTMSSGLLSVFVIST